MNDTNLITLDVREDFRAGESPCDKVHGAINNVRLGQTLRLLLPFEPVPLFKIAERIGLKREVRPHPNGDWEILFSRDEVTTPRTPAQSQPGVSACGCGCHDTEVGAVMDVDARGLQPPQPMVRILEALEQLPDNASLDARTDRRPVHLYGFLEDRGFTGESEEQSDGSFITHIRRR